MEKEMEIGKKVKVKKGLTDEEILKEYYDGPLDEKTEKEILDFFHDTEKIHTLTGTGNNCAVEEFGYYIDEYFLELV